MTSCRRRRCPSRRTSTAASPESNLPRQRDMADPDSAERCVLRLHGVAKAFSGIQALSGVSFDLRPGEIHALVGENGAGKSTLIKIVAGAYLPDSGVIEIDGASHAALSPEQARNLGVGVVYQ